MTSLIGIRGHGWTVAVRTDTIPVAVLTRGSTETIWPCADVASALRKAHQLAEAQRKADS